MKTLNYLDRDDLLMSFPLVQSINMFRQVENRNSYCLFRYTRNQRYSNFQRLMLYILQETIESYLQKSAEGPKGFIDEIDTLFLELKRINFEYPNFINKYKGNVILYIDSFSVDSMLFIGERIQELYKTEEFNSVFYSEGAIWKYFLNDSNNAADFVHHLYALQIKIEEILSIDGMGYWFKYPKNYRSFWQGIEKRPLNPYDNFDRIENHLQQLLVKLKDKHTSFSDREKIRRDDFIRLRDVLTSEYNIDDDEIVSDYVNWLR